MSGDIKNKTTEKSGHRRVFLTRMHTNLMLSSGVNAYSGGEIAYFFYACRMRSEKQHLKSIQTLCFLWFLG
jgi:hypothetical protein